MSSKANSRRASRRGLLLSRSSILAGLARLLNESRADVAREDAEDDNEEDTDELAGTQETSLRLETLQLVARDDGGVIKSPDDLLSQVLQDRELWNILRRNRSLEALHLARSVLSANVTAQLSKTLRASRGPASVNLEGAQLTSVRALSSLLQDAQRGAACQSLNLASVYTSAGEAPFKVLSGRASTVCVGPGRTRINFHGAFTTVALKEMATLRTGNRSFYYEVNLAGWPSEASWADIRIGWTDTWWVATTFEDATRSKGGAGVGDNLYSWAFDPFRARAVVDNTEASFGAHCKTGDVIGCYVDLSAKVIRFSVNGVWDLPFGTAFQDFSLWKGIVPALTVASARHYASSVEVNLGPNFAYPPDRAAAPIAEWLQRQKDSLLRSALQKMAERRTNRSLHSLLLSGLSFLQNRQRPHSVRYLCQAFQGLRHLDLSNCKLGDGGCASLCRELSDGLPGLLTLDLSSNELTYKGAKKLSRALLHSGIKYLDLCSNQLAFTGDRARALEQGPAADASELELEWTSIVGPGTQLAVIDLSWAEIDAISACALMSKLATNDTILGLRLDGNPLTGQVLSSLAQMLRENRTLLHLSLVSASISGDWNLLSQPLFDISEPTCSVLQALDLSGNPICADVFADVDAFLSGQSALRRLSVAKVARDHALQRQRSAKKKAEAAQRLVRALATSLPTVQLSLSIESFSQAQSLGSALGTQAGLAVKQLELAGTVPLLDTVLQSIAEDAPAALCRLAVRVQASSNDDSLPWKGLCDVLEALQLDVLRIEGSGDHDSLSSVNASRDSFVESLARSDTLHIFSIAKASSTLRIIWEALLDAFAASSSLKHVRIENCSLRAGSMALLARLVRGTTPISSIKFARGNEASRAAESLIRDLLKVSTRARPRRCRELLLHGRYPDLDAFRLTDLGLGLVARDLPLLGALLSWVRHEVLGRSRGPLEITNTLVLDGSNAGRVEQDSGRLDLEQNTMEEPLVLGEDLVFQGQLTISNWRSDIRFAPPLQGMRRSWRAIGLHFIDCPQLTSLPRGLEVASLVVRGCPALTTLPEDLRVWTMLVLENVPKLERLPLQIDVDHLEVRNCVALESVIHVRVRDTLVLSQCGKLTSLPGGMHLNKLEITECWNLRSNVETAHVQKQLCLRSLPVRCLCEGLELQDCLLDDCPQLETLPPDLEVYGSFKLIRCPLVKAVPSGVRAEIISLESLTALTGVRTGVSAQHKLLVADCPALGPLPETILSAGRQHVEIRSSGLQAFPYAPELLSCHIMQCAELLELPSSLRVKFELRLEQCGILQLPESLQVGSLRVFQCLNLMEIPPRAYCRGNMIIDSCPSVEELPDVLNLRGSLGLRKLPSLRSLPDNVRAHARIDIRDCTHLEKLSERMRAASLVLEDNPELWLIPESTRIASSIQTRNCSSLHSIPDSVLRNVQRVVVDEASPIGRDADLEFLEARCAALQTRLYINVTDDEDEDRDTEHERLDEAVAYWETHAGVTPELELESELDSFYHSSVLGFLNLLRRSAEFRRPDLREGLAQRVVELLRILNENPDGVREDLLSRISDAIDSCSDKPIWALNDMYLMTLIIRARGNRDALRSLGKRVMRLQIVRDQAAQHPGADQDDVCVYLRFEISLRESLDLPVSSVAMLYRTFVTVTPEEIEKARQAALGVSQAEFETWLGAWPEWERQLRAEAAATIRYETLDAEVLSRRSSLRAFSGEPMDHPVMVARRGPWELSELLDRWVVTGLDFANVALEPSEFIRSLHRALPYETRK
ncbi:Ryanodine receptor [Hondaea fermentalgiana]|uniref:Ryanodine receptor n=1 Tax=Hondaea fermentalgiana TaxID=2315210 RepID=A0A2R5G893_9STRA|nr:Ryanodine receptor [Hondaea fermentalgiana]|eukprot:GBG26008.1 Ryanodine receptor [Hondaea fermentalgiana]